MARWRYIYIVRVIFMLLSIYLYLVRCIHIAGVAFVSIALYLYLYYGRCIDIARGVFIKLVLYLYHWRYIYTASDIQIARPNCTKRVTFKPTDCWRRSIRAVRCI